MEFGDATDVLRKMVNHFRAFERVDEVLKAALRAGDAEKDAIGRKNSLEKEIKKDSEDFENIKKLRKGEILKLQKDISVLKEEVKKKTEWKVQTIGKFESDIKMREEETLKAITANNERVRLNLEFSKKRESKLQEEIGKLQKLLDGMIVKVDSVRNQIKGGG